MRSIPIAPALLLALLATVRAARLGPSRDELATQAFAALDLDALWRAVSHVDLVLAPYYVVAHTASRMVPGDLGLRIPSIAAAAVAIGAITWLARRWWGAGAALVAGFAAASNPLVVELASTARPYALAIAFVALAALAADRAGSTRQWALVAALLVGAGAMHLFSLLAAVPLLLVPAFGRGPRAVRGALAAGGAAAVVLAPFAVAAASQRRQIDWMTAPDPPTALAVLANLVSSPDRLAPDALDLAAWVVVAGLVAAAGVLHVLGRPADGDTDAARLADRSRWMGAFVATLGPWAVLLAVSALGSPSLRTAYIAPSAVGLALLLAGSLHRIVGAIGRRRASVRPVAARASAAPAFAAPAFAAVAATVGLIAAVGLSAAADPREARQDDFAGVAESLTRSAEPGDLLIVAQRHHETGLAAGLARFTDDRRFARDVAARLPGGSQPAVEVRVVVSTEPLRTVRVDGSLDATPDTRPTGTAWIVTSGIPLAAADCAELPQRPAGCAGPAERSERHGGLHLAVVAASTQS
ncbi:hypothetical protein GE115_09750 [Agromyces sp. CFH 90414]|uniref:Glycosyltransferase RgtA/B/C/D-like domain-containing protein n=1 Tax=Agromyces agglutinans TaxID=2662258 RepID=A0A6I2FBS0_9MICO|nr:glycosyltransferase family 39 protein [Agromyces agglutinans]MRG60150.1 hypothetical protein [Agromyces agglutinans]